MKRAVWALLACGLLAACEDLPTDVPGVLAPTTAATTNTANATSGTGSTSNVSRGSNQNTGTTTTVPRTTPATPAPTPTPESKSGGTIVGNQVDLQFPDGEPVSWINGVPIPQK